MLFNSLHFLIFLPLAVLTYYLLPFRFRWIHLFVASCYFYMAFVPSYILILFVIILIDYFSGIAIEENAGKRKKFFLILSISSNLLLLAFFKYFNFLNENLAALLSIGGKEVHALNLHILLPIGLSFHTFQSMSYTLEVYRGNQKAERHLGYFANYVLFFPQMVAGPIERYAHLGDQLKEQHVPRYENFSAGFRLILLGLFMKMTVADNLAPYVNEVYAEPVKFSSAETLLAVILFSFQIYADFAGYSSIAQGAARMLGIHIIDNFRTPYLSRSVSEFWTRWHISLSTWFRDYLYIPLGGNRVKISRWVFNIMLVFMLSGLWHGASWTFVAWGALHGIFLLSERAFRSVTGFSPRQGKLWLEALLVLKTFALTTVAWIFFRAESFSKVGEIFRSICTRDWSLKNIHELNVPLFFTVVLILIDLLVFRERLDKILDRLGSPVRWAFYAVMLFCILSLSGMQKYQFIYFQF
jgi:alginate O-acetyltransferase complex protein AlgI